MGKIKKAIIQQENERIRRTRSKPKEQDEKQEEWDVHAEGFYRDEIDDWNEEKSHLLLDPLGDVLEPASFSEDENSDEEVLSLKLSVSDTEEVDDEKLEEESIGPSDRAWGHRKTSFYDTDYIDDEGDRTSDESLAEEEEREAIALQQRMVESIRDEDFGLDSLKMLEATKAADKATKDRTGIKVTKELSTLSEEERFTLLQEEWPEFLELYSELSDKTQYTAHTLVPLLNSIESYPNIFSTEGSKLLEDFTVLNNLYSLNVMFYLMLRANQVAAEDHPVINRLVQLREILAKLRSKLGGEDKLTQVKKKIEDIDILKILDERKQKDEKDLNGTKMSLKKNLKRKLEDESDNEDPIEYYKRIKRLQLQKRTRKVTFQDEMPESEEEVDGKRRITYQIARNKGLTPKRKKEQRNPRVKHRKKYQKATTKYRHVVRPVERELVRYGGEKGGIKSRLSRSVKIK